MRHCFPAGIVFLLLYFINSGSASAQLQKIYFQPKAPGNTKQSKFIDSIRFIPLEAVEGVEKNDFINIQITDKHILLVDYGAKNIFFFTGEGAFRKKVSYKKLGDAFYPSYFERKNELSFFAGNKNYTLTPKDQLQIRLDWENERNKKYYRKYRIDLNDTNYTLQKAVPEQTDILHAYPFHDDYYWQSAITTSPLLKGLPQAEVNIFRDGKIVRSYFPYDPVAEPRFLFTEVNASYTRTDSNAFFIFRPFCDTIYKLVNDSMKPVFQLVMPLENSIPASFYTKPFKNKTERENYERNNGWVFRQVYNFFETPEFYYFAVRFQQNYDTYIYQKQGNATFRVRSVKSDTSQYNLSLLPDNNITRKGDRFYKLLKAGDLIKFFEENKDTPLPAELKDFLEKKPKETAPVIVAYKLKTTK